MALKHSKEPWSVHKGFSGTVFIYDGERKLEEGLGEYGNVVAGGICPKALTEANATRIIECVNACEGLDSPQEWRDFLEKVRTQDIFRIRKERDDLLESLRSACKYLETVEYSKQPRGMDVWYHLIAKCK